MNEWNLAPIPEISAFFRIFRALFMRNSRHFIIFWEYPWNSDKIPSNFRRKMTKFIDQNRNEMQFHFIPAKKFDGFLLGFWGGSGAKAKRSCRARKMQKNEPIRPRSGGKKRRASFSPQKKSFGSKAEGSKKGGALIGGGCEGVSEK